jgi:hypothetical protein
LSTILGHGGLRVVQHLHQAGAFDAGHVGARGLRGRVAAERLDCRADQSEVNGFLVADVFDLLRRNDLRGIRGAFDHQRVVEPRAGALEGEALAELVHQHARHAGLLRLGQRADGLGFLRVFHADPGEVALVAVRLGELGVFQHFLAAIFRHQHAAMVHSNFRS